MSSQKLISLLILDKPNTKVSLDLLRHVESILQDINKVGLFIKIVPVKPKIFETIKQQGKIKRLPCILVDDQPYTGEIKQIINSVFTEMVEMRKRAYAIEQQRKIVNMNEDDLRESMTMALGRPEDKELIERDQEDESGESLQRDLDKKKQEMMSRRAQYGLGEQGHFEATAGRPPAMQDDGGGMVRQPQMQQMQQMQQRGGGRGRGKDIDIPTAHFGGNDDDERMARYFEDAIADDWNG